MKEGWVPPKHNEVYQLLIDEYGEIWVSPQHLTPSRANTAYIATHRSLVGQAERYYKKPVKFLFGGELIDKNSEYAELNNKCSTFMGDASHLKFAINALKVKGIGLKPQTKIVDYSNSSVNLHELHADRRELLKDAHRPEYRAFINSWEPILEDLYKLYPNKTLLGDFDDKYYDEFYDYFSAKGEKPNFKVMGLINAFRTSIDMMVNLSLREPAKAIESQNALREFIKSRQNLEHQKPLTTPKPKDDSSHLPATPAALQR